MRRRGFAVVCLLLSSIILAFNASSEEDQTFNAPPVADGGRDTTVECAGSFFSQWKTSVQLDGTGSFDPDGDALTYSWSADGVIFDNPATAVTAGGFDLGSTMVVLMVSDGTLDASDTVYVTVEDTTPPQLSVNLNRDILWPPNHAMVDIFAVVAVTRDCCPGSPTVVLDSIWSNEPDNDIGDGDTVDDIQGAIQGTRDTVFKLRSERRGGGEGRVYSMVYTATDCAGNSASDTAYVRVPHDQSEGRAFASVGFSPNGLELDPASGEFAFVIPTIPPKIRMDKKKGEVLVKEGFDAVALDPDRIYVGNARSTIKPERFAIVDHDGDGHDDLAVFFSSRAVGVIVQEMTPGDAATANETLFGPIGFQYTSPAGEPFLVPDIFEMGAPVPLVLSSQEENGVDADPVGGDADDLTGFPRLLSNYPNPFNPSTTIPFEISNSGRVILRVYDARGALVRTLRDEAVSAGIHKIVWDGRDAAGVQVATGVYFVRLVAGDVTMTRKLVMIK